MIEDGSWCSAIDGRGEQYWVRLTSENDLSWLATHAGGRYGAKARVAPQTRADHWVPMCQGHGASLLRGDVLDTMEATDLLHRQAFCCCGQK